MYLLLGKNVSMYILEDDIAACVFEGWFWDEKSPRFYSVPVSFDPFIENIDGEFTLTEAQRANDETSKTLNKVIKSLCTIAIQKCSSVESQRTVRRWMGKNKWMARSVAAKQAAIDAFVKR